MVGMGAHLCGDLLTDNSLCGGELCADSPTQWTAIESRKGCTYFTTLLAATSISLSFAGRAMLLRRSVYGDADHYVLAFAMAFLAGAVAASLGAALRLNGISNRYSSTGSVVLIDAMVMIGIFAVIGNSIDLWIAATCMP
jgi:hypothetical protein